MNKEALDALNRIKGLTIKPHVQGFTDAPITLLYGGELNTIESALKNNKLYVITEGEYSDYHIVCIFTDKTKAENYVKYHQGGWDSAYIEEYDLADDDYKLISTGYYKIGGEVTIDKKGMIKHSQIFGSAHLTDTPENYSSLSDYNWKESSGEWNLHIVRSFPESSIHYEEEPAEKLMHILKDTAAMVATYKQQGYSLEDIEKMLGFDDE